MKLRLKASEEGRYSIGHHSELSVNNEDIVFLQGELVHMGKKAATSESSIFWLSRGSQASANQNSESIFYWLSLTAKGYLNEKG